MGGPRHTGLVPKGDGVGDLLQGQCREDGQRHPRADALHRLQQAEPLPLGLALEAKEADLVFAHMRLYREHRLSLLARQPGQHARRAVDLIANAANIEDDPILAGRRNHTSQPSDHRLTTFNFGAAALSAASMLRDPRWCAWQMAIASASNSSGD